MWRASPHLGPDRPPLLSGPGGLHVPEVRPALLRPAQPHKASGRREGAGSGCLSGTEVGGVCGEAPPRTRPLRRPPPTSRRRPSRACAAAHRAAPGAAHPRPAPALRSAPLRVPLAPGPPGSSAPLAEGGAAMRMRGRGPRDAPASSAGAGDARRLAPPGRNPFVHELRFSALQKAQVGAARAPRPVAGAAQRRDSGEGSPARPSPAAAPQAPAARAPHAALRPASASPTPSPHFRSPSYFPAARAPNLAPPFPQPPAPRTRPLALSLIPAPLFMISAPLPPIPAPLPPARSAQLVPWCCCPLLQDSRGAGEDPLGVTLSLDEFRRV